MLRIECPGLYQVTDHEVEVTTNGSVTLIIKQDVNITSVINEQLNLNLINEATDDIKINHTSKVYGQLVLTHAMLNFAGTKLLMKADLLKVDASIVGISASVAKQPKQYRFEINHLSPMTTSNIENYAVVLSEGKFYCDTIGKINQGFYESKAYQTSRVLTTTDSSDVKILPVLAIDENNVQAKHACTIGKLDQEQLYYLQSRGLSEAQALQLITRGYLSSILKVITDEAVLQTVKAAIERQVEWICSM